MILCRMTEEEALELAREVKNKLNIVEVSTEKVLQYIRYYTDFQWWWASVIQKETLFMGNEVTV